MKTLQVRIPALLLLLSTAAACNLDVGPQTREFYKAELRSIPLPPIQRCTPPAEPPDCPQSVGVVVLLIEDGRLFVDVSIENVEGARTATLHVGPEDSNTPPVATLWSTTNPAGISGSGLLTLQERIDANRITGATYQQVIDAIRTGNAYVILTTVDHPEGALRAQVEPAI